MKLTPEERQALLSLKIKKAQTALADMEANFKESRYETAANRLYYALFHACSALLMRNCLESYSHRGNMALIAQHFFKTNIIPSDFRLMIRDMYSIYQASEQDDNFEVGQEDLKDYIVTARQFIDLVVTLI